MRVRRGTPVKDIARALEGLYGIRVEGVSIADKFCGLLRLEDGRYDESGSAKVLIVTNKSGVYDDSMYDANDIFIVFDDYKKNEILSEIMKHGEYKSVQLSIYDDSTVLIRLIRIGEAVEV